ncbi:MAG: hypothetical protein M3O50_14065 [Myxococcota bacterium]|nr:hypothetical protein [Myxococcota bacterium]
MLPPAVLIADYAGTLEVLDRSEARARATKQLSSTQDLTGGLDLFTQPLVRANVRDRHWEYVVSYMPSLTVLDLESGYNSQNVQLLNVGTASIGWRDRGVRVVVSEEATYGTYNSVAQPPQSAQSGQAAGQATGQGAGTATVPATVTPTSPILLTPQTITFLSTRTLLAIASQIDTRTLFAVDGGYVWSGGLGAASRAVVPQQYGPRADVSFAYALTRSDQFVSNAYAQVTQFTDALCGTAVATLMPAAAVGSALCSPQDQIAQITVGVRHGVSASTSFEIDAGAAAARTRFDRDVPYDLKGYPSGRAAVTHRTGKGGHLTFETSAQLSPLIDPRTGLVSNFAQGQLSLTDPLTNTVTFHTALTGAQTVPTDAPLAVGVVSGTVEMTFRLDRHVDLGFGGSGAWQTQNSLGSFFFAYGYLAVTVHAPALRF